MEKYVASLSITGMHCASCTSKVQKYLSSIEGIEEVKVDLISSTSSFIYSHDTIKLETITTDFNSRFSFYASILSNKPLEVKNSTANLHLKLEILPNSKVSIKEILEKINTIEGVISTIPSRDLKYLRIIYLPAKIGSRALLELVRHVELASFEHFPKAEYMFEGFESRDYQVKLRWYLILSIPFSLTVFIITMAIPHSALPFLETHIFLGVTWKTFISFSLTTPVHFWIGSVIHIAAFKALKNRSTDMNVLISLATNIAYFYSLALMLYSIILAIQKIYIETMAFFETSSVLITFILIGRFIEVKVKNNTKITLDNLHSLSPSYTTLISKNDGISYENETLLTKALKKNASSTADKFSDISHETTKKCHETLINIPNLDLTTFSNTSTCTIDHTLQIKMSKINSKFERIIPTELLQIDDILKVSAGSIIPADGIKINKDEVLVDESMITGESTPIEKEINSFLIGGSTCCKGFIVMKVQKIGSESTLGQIIDLLSSSSSNKMRLQLLADKIASYFVLIVIICSVFTWIIWTILFFTESIHLNANGSEFNQTNEKVLFVLEFGIAVLAIACPCALGLASPTATSVAVGIAAKSGILVKNSEIFEMSSKLKALVLDKTGTLTKGKPGIEGAFIIKNSIDLLTKELDPTLEYLETYNNDLLKSYKYFSGVTKVISLEENLSATQIPKKHICDKIYSYLCAIWWIVGSAESVSEHPLGLSLTNFLKEADLPGLTYPENFTSIPGHGLSCKINSLEIKLASYNSFNLTNEFKNISKKLEKLGISNISEDICLKFQASFENWIFNHQALGSTVILLQASNTILGAFALRDRLRPESKYFINWLSKEGIEAFICSGDNKLTVEAIGKELNLPSKNLFSQHSPFDKAKLLEELSKKQFTGMVGDGINDSPALSKANLGIALGTGSHIICSAADVIIVKSRLQDLILFFKLSKSVIKAIKRNFFWAAIFNVFSIPIAAGILYPIGFILPPAYAGGIMAFSSIIVVLSSLLLKLNKY